MKKVLIVGGVAGGASCAARLRRLDENAEIILFERGEYISYANCGLPYYIGDVIQSRDSLFVSKAEVMRERFRIDVRTQHDVRSIDTKTKTITVYNIKSNETYTENYDTLVLSTGSSPVRPSIPGIDSDRILTLWTVPDTDQIKELINTQHMKSVAIIGGGFIGLEMAENLKKAGLDVSIIEMQNQVMSPIDYEMAQLVHENIQTNNVQLYLGDGVESFHDGNDKVSITLKSGKQVNADFVILSIGVCPNGELAKAAGLSVNIRGGIVVNKQLQTSNPDIYAIGDVIEVEDFILKQPTMIPLAGPANKQGRIAANNIAGGHEDYVGTQGTSIAKVFDLSVASTGLNEKTLQRLGFIKEQDYTSAIITQNSHAGYYPQATSLYIKLLFSMDGKTIYGAQIIGVDGVDKRIDTIATTIRLHGSIYDLKELEFAYAPPYNSAKDPVNMLGFVAENMITKKVTFSSWDVLEKDKSINILDVREEVELMTFALPNAVEIPLGQLRSRLHELDSQKSWVIFCAIGVRSYNALRILKQHGFEHVSIYPAGTKFYQSTHFKTEEAEDSIPTQEMRHEEDKLKKIITLDCSGMQCPGPIMKVYQTLQDMEDGEQLKVSASDPGFTRDIKAWCRRTGNTLLSTDKAGMAFSATIQKNTAQNTCMMNQDQMVQTSNDGKTIVVFSGDLDKVIASFIIANGAAAMGRPVTMFFTFWGLNVLRKPEKQKVKKSFMESVFGFMMPKGSSKLKLSKMNFGGLGTQMMKKIMNDKHVDSLESLIQKGMEAGIKMVACTMSMDVMGIKEEELMDGVELGGVGAYLGDAEESNVNLFI